MKNLMILLVVVVLFVSGCGNGALIPVVWIAVGAVGALTLSNEVEQPIESRQGAWFVDPNSPHPCGG